MVATNEHMEDLEKDHIHVTSHTPAEGLIATSAIKAVKDGNAEGVDIAARILAEYGEDNDEGWTPEEEKKLIRKVDWMIIPVVSPYPLMEFILDTDPRSTKC